MSTRHSYFTGTADPEEGTPARIVGTGPIRVLVAHGWIADHTLFDPFIAMIDGQRFSYAFLDCRGYGSRLRAAESLTIGAVARDVLAAADQLGWREFHVIGHSMGGMAAQRLMIDAPGRLTSAVLLAPVPASGARIDAARRDLLGRAIATPEMRRALIDANTGRTRPAEWIEHVLQLSLRSTRSDVLTAYLESWSGTDFSSEVRAVTMPVLVIVGELDPGAPHARMEETILRWYPHATLRQLTGVGHYPMQECPTELYAAIEQHLLAIPKRSAALLSDPLAHAQD